MCNCFVRSALFVVILTAGTARAASAQTCIAIDEQHDMLGRDDRTAARLLVGKQFELAGHRSRRPRLLGDLHGVPHSPGHDDQRDAVGSAGKREATALGLDDLPAVYSQMVRSLTTGQPMGIGVLDRTNVSASQDLPPRRVHSEGSWYARVGYGSLFGQSTHNGASFGFGYRAEFDRIGLDVSFFNGQLNDAGGYRGANGSAWSLIKLQGLYFLNPTGNRSAYFGGGLSYGRTELQTSTHRRFFERRSRPRLRAAGWPDGRVRNRARDVRARVRPGRRDAAVLQRPCSRRTRIPSPNQTAATSPRR